MHFAACPVAAAGEVKRDDSKLSVLSLGLLRLAAYAKLRLVRSHRCASAAGSLERIRFTQLLLSVVTAFNEGRRRVGSFTLSA